MALEFWLARAVNLKTSSRYRARLLVGRVYSNTEALNNSKRKLILQGTVSDTQVQLPPGYSYPAIAVNLATYPAESCCRLGNAAQRGSGSRGVPPDTGADTQQTLETWRCNSLPLLQG